MSFVRPIGSRRMTLDIDEAPVLDGPMEGAPHLEQMRAAFLTENEVVSTIRRMQDTADLEKPADHKENPYHIPQDQMDAYPLFKSNPEAMFGLWNEEHAKRKHARIADEVKALTLLGNEGWSAFGWSGLAGIASPTTPVSLGAGVGIRGIKELALRGGGSAVLGIGLQEMVLQSTTENRTWQQSMAGLGAGALLGTAISGGIAGISRAHARALTRAIKNQIDPDTPKFRYIDGKFYVQNQAVRIEQSRMAEAQARAGGGELNTAQKEAIYQELGDEADSLENVQGLIAAEEDLMIQTYELQYPETVTRLMDDLETDDVELRQRLEDYINTSDAPLSTRIRLVKEAVLQQLRVRQQKVAADFQARKEGFEDFDELAEADPLRENFPELRELTERSLELEREIARREAELNQDLHQFAEDPYNALHLEELDREIAELERLSPGDELPQPVSPGEASAVAREIADVEARIAEVEEELAQTVASDVTKYDMDFRESRLEILQRLSRLRARLSELEGRSPTAALEARKAFRKLEYLKARRVAIAEELEISAQALREMEPFLAETAARLDLEQAASREASDELANARLDDIGGREPQFRDVQTAIKGVGPSIAAFWRKGIHSLGRPGEKATDIRYDASGNFILKHTGDLRKWLELNPEGTGAYGGILPRLGKKKTEELRRIYTAELHGEATRVDAARLAEELERSALEGTEIDAVLIANAFPLNRIAKTGGFEFLGRRWSWLDISRILDNPQGRKVVSPNDYFRLVIDHLSIAELKTDGNFVGKLTPDSAELGVMVWKARTMGAFRDIKKIFAEYEQKVLKEGKDHPLTFREFDEAIYDAAVRNSRAEGNIPANAIKEVEAAATILRHRLYLPVAEMLEDLTGHASKGDPFAYMLRVYNVHKISKDRVGFEKQIFDAVAEQVERLQGRALYEESVEGRIVFSQRNTIELMVTKWVDNTLKTPFKRIPDTFEEFARKQARESLKKKGGRGAKAGRGKDGDFGRAGRQRVLGIGSDDFLEVLRLTEFPKAHIEVPYSVLKPWLRRSAIDSTTQYLHTRIPDMEIAKKFRDDPMLTNTLERFDKSYQDLITKSTDPEEIAQLNTDWATDRKYIEGVRDNLRNTIGLPADPETFAGMSHRVARQLKNYNIVRVAGYFTVVAMADVANTALQVGLSRTMGHMFAPWISETANAMRQMSRRELEKLGVVTDDVLHLRGASLWDVTEFAHYNSRWEQGMNSITHKVFNANLLTPWTNWMRMIASQGILDEFIRVTRKVRAGEASADDLARMTRAHMEPGIAVEILEQIERSQAKARALLEENPRTNIDDYAQVDDQGRVVLGSDTWDSPRAPELKRLLRNMILEDTQRAVVTPGAGDVPIWLRTQLGSVVGQFKSFGFSVSQKVAVPALQGLSHGDTRILNAIPLTVAMGAIVYIAKSILDKGEDADLSPGRVIQEGIVRSDLWGAYATVDDISHAVSAGTVSLRGTIGPDTAHGYTGQSWLMDVARTLGGPSVDTGTQLGSVAASLFTLLRDGGMHNLKAKDVRAFRRILPLQNLFYLDRIFDMLEEGMAEEVKRSANDYKLIRGIAG